jgi:ankyrin repeat protein
MRRWIFWLLPGFLLSVSGFAATNGDPRLPDAAMNGDKAAVRSLLGQKVPANSSQPDGTTALHWAVNHNDLETADLLIRAGAKVTTATRYGVTPLYFACVNGSAAMIEKLLRAGADANSANPGGETPLMTASRTGKVDAVQVLLDHGAVVNATEKLRGQTALMWAVLEDHQAVVKLLLAHGADINARTEVSVPEGLATIPGPNQASGAGVARQRAKPSATGEMTPLLYAAREGNIAMARLLLEAKANINQPSANGTTSVTIAVINNHIELAMYLLEKGADPNIADSYGRTPLIAAVEMRNLDHPRTYPDPKPDGGDPLVLIKALLAHGADVNHRSQKTPVRGFLQSDMSWVSSNGQTPFLRAALSGDITVMRLLLENGADPNIPTDEGTTPLMTAAGINWVTMQTNSRSDGEYLEAAQLCLDHGADVNAVNAEGFTAMHGAANRGFDAMVKLLAEHGARLDIKDKVGRTPLTFAQGVFLAGYPPQAKPSTIALLHQLAGDKVTGETAVASAGKP